MNLPFVLDIAIGLVFIYLILSLLASELQELLSTLLQWRAKHLRDSIENLFADANQDPEKADELSQQTQALVKRIYDDPLLRNVNQEAKGLLAIGFRRITWGIAHLYQKILHRQEGDFGDRRSGPSYIAPDTFATTFMETLGLPVLIEKLVESRLEKFATKILEGIHRIAEQALWDLNQNRNFQLLEADFTDIVQDFNNNEATLLTCIDRLSESLDIYIKSLPVETTESSLYPLFSDRVRSFKSGLFGTKNERAILAGGLQPTLMEMVEILDSASRVHQEIQAAFADRDSATYQKIKANLDHLPDSVRASFAALARRAYTRKKQTESNINQLREEISVWFDRSMSRASGVYKRNAKGVAILLGILIAITTNADMFHIFGRLSSDENLRQIVTSRASQIVPSPDVRPSPSVTSQPPRETLPNTAKLLNTQTNLQQELEAIKKQTDRVLQDITLPLSWNLSNLTQQFQCADTELFSAPLTDTSSIQQPQLEATESLPKLSSSKDNLPLSKSLGVWDQFIQQCLSAEDKQKLVAASIPRQVVQVPLSKPFSTLKIILGWLLSGIAIAMGAPFWFDLLSKVMNVRNTGSKPAPIVPEDQPK
ncbi:hypothetical protein ACN4EK_30760 [Pantanalinema rosaneae CENA516]|uniref:hypothetical protein n=1 Tax=Pantanalinema rosaneae TaxID=1620701 RepID=UPI003D6DFB7C